MTRPRRRTAGARQTLAALAAPFVLLANGCLLVPLLPHTPPGSDHRGATSAADVDSLVVGACTREDVLLCLGEPDLRTAEDRTFGYVWDEAWLLWAVFGAGGSGGIGELASHIALMVAFDESGRLVRKEIVQQDKLTSDATWFTSLRSWP